MSGNRNNIVFRSNRLAKLVEEIFEHGGVTVDVQTDGRPDGGFMVSGGFEVRVQGHREYSTCDLVDLVGWYLRINWAHLTRPGCYFGAWIDPEDGSLYLDVSERFEDEGEARIAAVAGCQVAFYDVKNAEVLYV